MGKTTLLTRKIKLFPVGDKDEVNRVYDFFRDGQYAQYLPQVREMAQLGFFCEADGDGDICMDENELKYAEWVKREDIVLQPNNLSLTNEMMKMFKEGKVS